MLSEARQKKIMEKLNRAQKCSILGPQNLGSGGGPPWIRTCRKSQIWLNFHFRGRGTAGGYRIVKTQVLAKFLFLVVVTGSDYFRVVKMRIGILGKMSKIFIYKLRKPLHSG